MVSRPRTCAECERLLSGLPAGLALRLTELADATRMDPSPEGRLHRAMEALADTLDADRTSLLLPAGAGTLRIAASSDRMDIGDLLISLDRYPELETVLARGEPVLVPDVASSPLLAVQLGRIRRAGLCSLAAAPLAVERTRGILRMSSRTRPFHQGDLDGLVAAAHLLGHVLEEDPPPETEGVSWLELLLRLADGVLVVGADGTVRRALGRWRRLGLEPAGILGQSFERLLAPECEARARADAMLVLQGGTPSAPSRFRLRNGEGGGAPVRVWAVRRPGGRGLLVAVRREREEATASPQAAAGLAGLPGLALATGPDGAIREASPALHRELAGDPVGRPLDSVLTAGEDGGHRLAAGNGSGIPVEVEEAPAPDGGRILLLWPRRGPSATPLEERLRRTIARNLEEMDELSRRLEEMDNERARFLAWSAHELKTPLTVIQSHLEILLEDLAEGLSHEQMEFLRIAHDATRRMRRMVLDLTDLAALQSGRMHLEIQRVSLEDTMAGVTRDLEPAARGAGVTLTRRPTRLQVRGDRVRLEQILHNLLDNAIRFTPEGGRVELSATREGERAAVRVSDTGVGIPPDQLETVFEPFVQAGRPPEGRAKGSGLGLFVCRRIALALGGRIEAAARPAGGTVFTLWLPLWPEEEPSR